MGNSESQSTKDDEDTDGYMAGLGTPQKSKNAKRHERKKKAKQRKQEKLLKQKTTEKNSNETNRKSGDVTQTPKGNRAPAGGKQRQEILEVHSSSSSKTSSSRRLQLNSAERSTMGGRNGGGRGDKRQPTSPPKINNQAGKKANQQQQTPGRPSNFNQTCRFLTTAFDHAIIILRAFSQIPLNGFALNFPPVLTALVDQVG